MVRGNGLLLLLSGRFEKYVLAALNASFLSADVSDRKKYTRYQKRRENLFMAQFYQSHLLVT